MDEMQSASVEVRKIAGSSVVRSHDLVAVEEPLEISVVYGDGARRERKVISVTMRTPGDDEALAVGFLFTEGLIGSKEQIENVVSGPAVNAVTVTLHPAVQLKLSAVDRNFYTTSSCGVCGKSSIEAVRTVSIYAETNDSTLVDPKLIRQMPIQLQDQQRLFRQTGGLHASALFDSDGQFSYLYEDVGRHNALDKLIGTALMRGQLPLSGKVLFLSGRISFELVQKAHMAGAKVVAAVGAPSSLAISLARDAGITLIGFIRDDRLNVYSGWERISDC